MGGALYRKIAGKIGGSYYDGGTVINLPSRTIYLYVTRACSVALQKGLATAINKCILNINSKGAASFRVSAYAGSSEIVCRCFDEKTFSRWKRVSSLGFGY